MQDEEESGRDKSYRDEAGRQNKKHKSQISTHKQLYIERATRGNNKCDVKKVRSGETHGNGCDSDDEQRKESLCGILWLRECDGTKIHPVASASIPLKGQIFF